MLLTGYHSVLEKYCKGVIGVLYSPAGGAMARGVGFSRTVGLPVSGHSYGSYTS